MSATDKMASDHGLTAVQWGLIWRVVHFITEGDFPADDAFDVEEAGNVPSVFQDHTLHVGALHQWSGTASDGLGAVVYLENVDRDALGQSRKIATHLGLAVHATADLHQDSGSGEWLTHLVGSEMSLSIDGSEPEYCDDESDASVTLTFDFGAPEPRQEAADRTADAMNSSILAALRANLEFMPERQRLRLVPTLQEVVCNVLPLAA
ncbi:hypothetical protein IMW82_13480 [Rhodanobacter sp. B2A1Ga4]|uniref:hypothetical protein n=1 Tax=Rhodanobacter sp. B2A1Ga4 TaxID=2778647 RepID=UPI001B392B90|nr:hypothetical protein [Rhodanobacter sp. B2A1Ga4]MBQ4855683.1 hypothetical protein [Rhodanobacter sp. B2A1Ga4]